MISRNDLRFPELARITEALKVLRDAHRGSRQPLEIMNNTTSTSPFYDHEIRARVSSTKASSSCYFCFLRQAPVLLVLFDFALYVKH